jgi:hypothetical protein
MSISTATPELLPEIADLRRLTQAIAALDAILCPEWDYRYYSYNSKWAPGEEMASMRDGCGDEWFLLFDAQGAALKGFSHESPLAADDTFPVRIQQTVPVEFASFLNEPAFAMEYATFCLWRRHNDAAWNVVAPAHGRISPEADGSEELIGILDGKPETYQEWAEAYYEKEVPLEVIQTIYAHQPVTDEMIEALNPECPREQLRANLEEIGYPHTL